MVHDEVWKASLMKEGFLCIGCLESRLNRRLTPNDFTDCPLNRENYYRSNRLRHRLFVRYR